MKDRLLSIKVIVNEKLLPFSASQLRTMAESLETSRIPMMKLDGCRTWLILESKLQHWMKEQYKNGVDRMALPEKGQKNNPGNSVPHQRKKIPPTLKGHFYEVRSGKLQKKIRASKQNTKTCHARRDIAIS